MKENERVKQAIKLFWDSNPKEENILVIFERFAIEIIENYTLFYWERQRVLYVVQNPKIAEQLDKIPVDVIREELKDFEIWNDTELKDDIENRYRIMWLATGGATRNKSVPSTLWTHVGFVWGYMPINQTLPTRIKGPRPSLKRAVYIVIRKSDNTVLAEGGKTAMLKFLKKTPDTQIWRADQRPLLVRKKSKK